MTSDDIDARLRNWARVVTSDRGSRRSVGSLEGHYRSPQPWDAPVHGLSTPLTGANLKDGWEVEAAWATLKAEHRIILRAHYCWKAHKAVASRMLRKIGAFNQADYSLHLIMAQLAIGDALRRNERQNRNIVRKIVQKALALVSGRVYKGSTI